MKTIVFTLCSVNYLAQAKTLGDSLKEHNPDYHFVIGLVDRVRDKVNPSFWHPYELIEVEKINVPQFESLCRKYNIVELNTAVKPFYIEYLYNDNPEVESVIYLDPDIFVFSSFKEIEANLKEYNIILTPHSCTATHDDSNVNDEIAMLQMGLYNLGFIATSRSHETFHFLKWWQSRLRKYCFYRPEKGLFVDQIWTNFIPFYYQNVYVEKNLGYNVSYWNLFERKISCIDGKYLVNKKYDLIFYHFSSYNPLNPHLITNKRGSHLLSDRSDLENIFTTYQHELLKNNYENMIKIECEFFQLKEPTYQKVDIKVKTKNVLKNSVRKTLSRLPQKLKDLIKKINLLILEAI